MIALLTNAGGTLGKLTAKAPVAAPVAPAAEAPLVDGAEKPPAEAEAEDKAKPNFAPSGLLAAATKTVQHGDGTKTVLKYHEPPEARKPVQGWRLYVFRGEEQTGKASSCCN